MTQTYRVELTENAQTDLNELVDFIAQHDAPIKALHVLEQIEGVLTSLQAFPERGAIPKELLALGNREYRETYFKPYRIIYKVVPATVFVYVIADGRRDLRSLLSRRMLQA
nr:type II toxin-antitoxin system RelE/ParE family toxin [uncultured Albidiferax sp.]